MTHTALSRNVLSAGVLLAVFAAAPVAAQNQSIVFGGADVTENGRGAYLGVATAFNGDLGKQSGWTTTTIIGYSKYSDDSVSPTSESTSTTASVLLGYNFVHPDWYATLSLGVDYVNNEDDPSSNSPAEGEKTGAIAQISYESKRENAFYIGGFGTYMTANERSYTQLRAGYKKPSITFGLEAIHASELDSNPVSGMGVFLSGIALGSGEIGLSAGYFDERGGTSGDGGYFAMEYSVPVRF